jgi:hypothetical protein
MKKGILLFLTAVIFAAVTTLALVALPNQLTKIYFPADNRNTG